MQSTGEFQNVLSKPWVNIQQQGRCRFSINKELILLYIILEPVSFDSPVIIIRRSFSRGRCSLYTSSQQRIGVCSGKFFFTSLKLRPEREIHTFEWTAFNPVNSSLWKSILHPFRVQLLELKSPGPDVEKLIEIQFFFWSNTSQRTHQCQKNNLI